MKYGMFSPVTSKQEALELVVMIGSYDASESLKPLPQPLMATELCGAS